MKLRGLMFGVVMYGIWTLLCIAALVYVILTQI